MQDEFKVGRFFKSAVTALLERKEITGASSLREILATERILEIIASPLRTQRIREMIDWLETHDVPYHEIWGLELGAFADGRTGFCLNEQAVGKPWAHVYGDDRQMFGLSWEESPGLSYIQYVYGDPTQPGVLQGRLDSVIERLVAEAERVAADGDRRHRKG